MRPRSTRWLAFTGLVLLGCTGPSGPRELADDTHATADDDTGAGDTASHDGTSGGEDHDAVDGSTGDTGGTDPDGADTGTDTGDPPVFAPEVYPADRTHSPVTAWVADRLHAIASVRADRFEDVFMKVGASSTVNHNTLYCFAGDAVDLAEHDALDPTLQYFLGGDAAGTTPFDRDTLAAEGGRTASWAVQGDPSPLLAELGALSPRLAFVHYGANDMGAAATYDAALQAFYLSMSTLLDGLEVEGVVPVVFGITRRADNASANLWVSTFNTALRGLAQARQVPFVDLHHAIDPLPGHGLGPDGLHLEAYDGGACILDEAGLEHGYNMRNLVALEALDRAVAVLVDDVEAIEEPAAPRAGSGSAVDPIVIDALPFADARDTSRLGAADIAAYGCGPRDESGPEVWYRLELDAPRPVRIVVLDREGVDVDVHVLDDSGDPGAGCVARDDRLVQATLGAGVWHVVVDTWTDDTGPLPGPYLLLVVECAADDPACA